MSTKQFTVRMESQGGAQVKTDLAGIGEAGKAAHDKISQGAKESGQSTEKVTQEQARAARAFQQLKASIDPVYAAQLKYDKAVTQVQRATTLGIASKEEEARVLAQLQAQHEQNIAAMERGAAQAAAFGRTTKASTMQVANLGAQFNDIGVMLAAGQSPLQLAVQQGTQINQVFAQMGSGREVLRGVASGLASMVSPMSLVTIGVIAGGAALIQWIQKSLSARDAAEQTKEAVDDLAASYSDYARTNDLARSSTVELTKEFGRQEAVMRRTLGILEGIQIEKTIDAIRGSVEAIDVGRLRTLVDIAGQGAGEISAFSDNYNRALKELQENFGLGVEGAAELLSRLDDLATVKGPEDLVATADKFNRFLLDTYGHARNIPPELREMALNLGDAQAIAARMVARMQQTKNEADGAGGSLNNATNAAGDLAGQLSVAASYAAQLAANLAVAPAGIQSFQQEAERLTAQIAALDAGYDQIAAGAAGYRKELEQKYGLADAANAAEDAYISAVINRQVQEYENVQRLNKQYSDKVTALNKVSTASSGTGSAAKAAAKDLKAMADEIERLEFDADPLLKFNDEIAELDSLLANGLSDGAYRKAVEDLNAELVESTPIISSVNDAFGNLIDYTLSGFKDGMAGVWAIFRKTLTDMIATAAKSRITFSLAAVASGGATAATAGQPAASAASSLFGGSGFLGLGGGKGSLFGGSGLLGMGGGTGFLGLGSGSGLATSLGGGAFGAAASVALPIAAVGLAVASFFKSTKEIVANGISIQMEEAIAELSSYEKSKKVSGWGSIHSGFKRDFDRMDDAVQKALADRVDFVLGALDDFGLNTDLTGFSFSSRTEIKDGETAEGETEEMIRAAIAAAVQHATGGALDAFVKDGESISETLARLSTAIHGVNETFELLGFTMMPLTLAGADAANSFAGLFGGVEAFAKSVGAYVDAFYDDQAKLDLITKQVTDMLSGLNVNNFNTAMNSREDFRALTDWFGNGAATMPDHAQWFADLINAAPLVDQMFDLREALAQTDDAVGDVSTGLDNLNQIAREQESLLLREARLKGDTAYIRAQELASVDASNVHILERIFALEDEQAAAEAAARAAEEAAQATAELARQQEAVAREADGLMAQYERLIGDQEAIRARELAGVDAANRWILEMIHAREDEVAAMEAAEQAAAELEAALEAEAAKAREIADERAGLEKRILELLGDTAALRQLEIDAVDAANQHLVIRIHNILDEQAANDAAARAAEEAAQALEAERQAQEDLAAAAAAAAQAIADEAYALETQWLQATGDVAALRARELELLDPSNRALQERIWAYLDEQEAIAAATAAAEEQAQAAREAEQALLDAAEAERQRIEAIAGERYRLETRLYELQGNTALLRERELALLDPSNRELQKLIWSLEDAAAAADDATGGVTDLSDVLGKLRSEMRDALSLVESLIGTEIDAIQNAAQARIDALQSEIDLARDLADTARDTLQGAFDVVRASIDADRTMLVAGYTAAIEALDSRMSAATANVDRLRGVFDLLDGALSSRLLGGAVREGARYMQAQSYIRGLTGLPANTDALEGALQALSDDGSRFYGNTTDYEFDFLRINAALAGLRDQAGGQLSDAERQIAAIEGARAAREAQHERELARLDDQLAVAQGIYDEALGNTISLMDVGDGIDGLRSAADQYTSLTDQLLAIEATAGAEIEAVRIAADAQVGLLEAQLAEARRSVEIAEGTYSSIETIQEAIDYLNQTIAAFSEANAAINEQVAADTTQPIIDIPEQLREQRNENSEQNARLLEQNRQLTDEVRQLHDDVTQLLKAISINTKTTASLQVKFDAEGIKERTT